MKGDKSNITPIMTNSESIFQFGNNAYGKPATALNILRETVLGRELFDYAFKEYCRRWMFKHPSPADFFRTMEDASAVDLDWFWRGWFFDTDHVDIGISDVRAYQISSQDPDEELAKDRIENAKKHPESITQLRNREEGRALRIDKFENLEDFYNENDKFTPTNKDRNKYDSFLEGLEPWERAAYDRALEEGQSLYFIDFTNHGGLISPLPLTLTFANGETEDLMIPAEIWRRNSHFVTKLIIRKSPLASVELDRHHQTADADYNNNSYPPVISPSRLELYKSKRKRKNLMADMLVALKTADKDTKGALKMDESEDIPLKAKDMKDADTKPESEEKLTSKKAIDPEEKPKAEKPNAPAVDRAETETTPVERKSDKSLLDKTLDRFLNRDK